METEQVKVVLLLGHQGFYLRKYLWILCQQVFCKHTDSSYLNSIDKTYIFQYVKKIAFLEYYNNVIVFFNLVLFLSILTVFKMMMCQFLVFFFRYIYFFYSIIKWWCLEYKNILT